MIKLDYGRYRESVKSSEQKSRKALTLSDLTGDVLDIIGDYLNINETTPPYFTLCNSRLLINFSSYKKENYSI